MDTSYNTILLKKRKRYKIIVPCMIDTNFSDLPTSECFSESEIKDQFNHIKRRLRVSNADWKIICGHHTWKSVGDHGNILNWIDF